VPAVAASVYFTYKPQFGKYLKNSINSNQSDTGVFRPHLFVYLSRRKLFLAGAKHFEDSSPLGGELIVMLF
jgi:hypothetical protein